MRGSRISHIVRWGLGIGSALGAMTAPAASHPHVFVTARSAFVIDGTGNVTGIRHVWTFDEAYSAFAMTGMKRDSQGRIDRQALDDLAKINIESLNEFKYFTSLRRGRSDLEFADPPPGYHLEETDKSLTLHFLLPLKAPVSAGQPLSLRVDDESIFVAFDFARDTPVTIEGGDGRCSVQLRKPKKSLASPDISKLSEEFFSNLTQGFSNDYATTAVLECRK